MNVPIVTLATVLKQYRIEHWIQDDLSYKQVTISKYSGVSYRGERLGKEIGRKRQFIIDLKKYPNTLLFIRQGVQEGGIGLAPMDVDGCVVTENMPMFSVKGVNPYYLSFFLKSTSFKEQVNQLVPVGSAQKALHERELLKIEIPLPSESEQEQIVLFLQSSCQKVDEINKELTQQQTYLKLLRQTILQEAVQGKLTHHEATDEPASTLLARIKAEKARLIKAGKLKKEKELPPITESEMPFTLPEGWVWCRLGEIIDCERGRFSIRPRNDPRYYNGDYPFIQIGDLHEDGGIIKEHRQSLNDDGLKVSKLFPKGTIAIAIVGGTIGNTGVLAYDMCFPDSIIGITPSKKYSSSYIGYYLQSKKAEYRSISYAGGGQPNIKMPTITNSIIALPPLAEQHRIVAKVQQHQQQLNALENQLSQHNQNANLLLQTILKEAFQLQKEAYVINETLSYAAEA